jgi:hypothetical protein
MSEDQSRKTNKTRTQEVAAIGAVSGRGDKDKCAEVVVELDGQGHEPLADLNNPCQKWLEEKLTSDAQDFWGIFFLFHSQKLKNGSLKQLGSVFFTNLSGAEDSVELPFYIAAFPYYKDVIARSSAIASDFAQSLGPSLPEIEDVLARLNRYPEEGIRCLEGLTPSDNFQALADSISRFVSVMEECSGSIATAKMTSAMLPYIEFREDTIPAFENLFRAAASSIWTAFEVLAADLWEYCMNSAPAKLILGAMKEARGTEVEGLTQKQISVDLLGKYGFNLAGVMGTVLKQKFDFSSVGGMEMAYKVLFSGNRVFPKELIPELYLLEQTRHLIQHRAGVVDEKFVKATGTSLPIGARLTVNSRELTSFKRTVIMASLILLAQADEIMAAQEPLLELSDPL